ncbi:MAG: leucine-rich repeat domain-containing protein [Candidatus Thiosymbion ectosymbiont of Robbea hypermnestra]|nr:leucine-rich repeat domain-containing protein [Candidatus Thiosymbion ectosymbiont of Robbea hypermnestra]
MDLRHTGIEDIRGLDHICPNLTTLDIRSTQVRSLEGLPASVTTLYVGDRTSYKRPEDQ